MAASPPPARSTRNVERLLERIIFGSRWLLAPFYLGLSASLMVLLFMFATEAARLFAHALTAGGDEIMLGILALIDLSLMANLLLMVILAGYESFVSRLDVAGHEGRLE